MNSLRKLLIVGSRNFHSDTLLAFTVLFGELSKSEELARKSIASFEISSDIADMPEHLNNLAQVLITRGKYVEADEVFDRAAVIQDTMIGRADPKGVWLSYWTLTSSYSNSLP